MKKRLMVLSSVVLAVFAFVLLMNFNHPKMNNNNYINPKAIIQGEARYEMNLENAITKMSTDIVIGIPTQRSEIDLNHEFVTITVDEVLMGELTTKSLKIRTGKYALADGQKYILFLDQFDSPLFEDILFNNLDDYFLKVDENSNVAIVRDPINETQIMPFQQSKYNNLAYIKDFVKKEKWKNIPRTKLKRISNGAKNVDELISISSHIVEIKALKVDYLDTSNSTKKLAAVSYSINKLFKGGTIENSSMLLLPEEVVQGEEYLLFMVENPDGGLTLATRNGSVVKVGSRDYKNIMKHLRK